MGNRCKFHASLKAIAIEEGVSWQRIWAIESRAFDKLARYVIREAKSSGMTPDAWLYQLFSIGPLDR
jgi:hypothetical protein